MSLCNPLHNDAVLVTVMQLQAVMTLLLSGSDDSSPSHQDKASKRSASAQLADDTAAPMELASRPETAMDTAQPVADGVASQAAKAAQDTTAAEDAVRTPKRAPSASAFSAFMSPLNKRSGQSCSLCALPSASSESCAQQSHAPCRHWKC